MSRKSVSNARYMFAFGVDHTPMGAFFQVFDKTCDDDFGSPIVEADALFGVQEHYPEAVDENPALREIIDRLIVSFRTGRNLTEEQVIDAGAALGLDKKSFSNDVYALWD